MEDLLQKTISELRHSAKEDGLSGYSKLNKQRLVDRLIKGLTQQERLSKQSKMSLLEMAKQKLIAGYRYMTKASLIDALRITKGVNPTPEPYTITELLTKGSEKFTTWFDEYKVTTADNGTENTTNENEVMQRYVVYLSKLSVPHLRDIARRFGVPKYYKLDKNMLS